MVRTPENALTHLVELLEGYPEVVEPLTDIVREYMRAIRKHPDWPADPVHASAILNEEAGELTQATLDATYADLWVKGLIKEEAAQAGAMSMRLLANIETHEAFIRQKRGIA